MFLSKIYYRYLRSKKLIFLIPFLKKKINKKLGNITKTIEKDFNNNYDNIKKLPLTPFNDKQIDDKLKEMMNVHEIDKNKISGVIYHGEEKHKNKLLKVFERFVWSNPLHPELFPSIREMEIDIVNMSIDMFNGNDKCLGNVTSGGTESIILACKTYRDWGKNEKGITKPNIVVLASVHPAFDKACHYFGIKIIKVPVDDDGTNISRNIFRQINSNTICVVGSAPSYAHGIIDPIVEISDYCHSQNIGFHLDCCLGGFLVPFIKKQENLDFRSKGITSISLDTHKYGYSLKGSSVLLFRSYNFKKYQHFVIDNWNGGLYGTPTIMGSKSGAIIATAWASLLYMGIEKYTKIALEIQNGVRRIVSKFKNNKYIQIIGEPDINVVAFKSCSINIFKVIQEMKNKNWNLNILQEPGGFHMTITNKHLGKIDEFIEDLEKSIKTVIKNPGIKLSGTMAIYGSNKTIEESLFTKNIVDNFIHLLSKKKISYIYE